jgi:GTPase SAR1 family protein
MDKNGATMTDTGAGANRDPIARANAVVDLGLRACAAYDRPDLAARLEGAKRALADPAIRIVVVGEFKQGKSTLVNALLGASICPVDDDIATAVPTYIKHGDEAHAELLYAGDPPRREPVPIDDMRRFVVEGGQAGTAGHGGDDRVIGVEVRVPRRMLAGGLVLVDTPGVGGLNSAHAAASLAACSVADAVLFVTDASQELTVSEADFLHRAQGMCDRVVCVLTKTDFYPDWRTIKELDEKHLQALSDVPLIAVSSTLRARAVKTNDKALNAESGFVELVKFVSERVAGGGVSRLAATTGAEVGAVSQQLEVQFAAERATLADPGAAKRIIAELTAAKERAEELKAAVAKWNQTLTDGIADLNADIDFDLRGRIRRIIQEADDAIEEGDPADTWAEMEAWLESRASYELLENYSLLANRAGQLSQQVGEHFRAASGPVFDRLEVYNPTPVLGKARVDKNVKLDKMGVRQQAFVAVRGAYGGVLMVTLLSSMTGVVLGPLGVAVGLVMGRKSLKDEKQRQLLNRRMHAKNAVRRYCDEVQFMMSKDSRDTLRRIQRQLRDHYSARAQELNRSTAQALAKANEAAKRTQAEREKRLKDLDAELARLRQLRQRAAAVLDERGMSAG